MGSFYNFSRFIKPSKTLITITKEDFAKLNDNKLTHKLYMEAMDGYSQHTTLVSEQTVPVFKNIRQMQSAHIENIIVPFTDERKTIDVLTPLNITIEISGRGLVPTLEKSITFSVMDDAWKDAQYGRFKIQYANVLFRTQRTTGGDFFD